MFILAEPGISELFWAYCTHLTVTGFAAVRFLFESLRLKTIDIVYFNQLSGAVRTQKVAKYLFLLFK